jgi:hypothetical protein
VFHLTSMKLIAHRGLTNGPTNLENSPDQIEYALRIGYDCEIDVWKHGNQFYLGHNDAQYEIPESFLKNNQFWIHAKNLEALHFLCLNSSQYHFFWHEGDAYAVTNLGYIWTYPKQQLTDISVCVMPETFMQLESTKQLNCYAICSDYVDQI